MANKDSSEQLDVTEVKVLITDDDAPTRMLLRAAVSQWGYKVVEATDGEEAWTILQEPDAPQLLIVDWLMPRLDGPSLCMRIKQELKSQPYIILLTQVSGTTNIIKGLEAGADEFLSKPFNMAELRSRLSVGARILGYKKKLAEQYQKLQCYIQQVTALTKEKSVDDSQKTDLVTDLRQLAQTNGGTLVIENDENDENEKIRYVIELTVSPHQKGK